MFGRRDILEAGTAMAIGLNLPGGVRAAARRRILVKGSGNPIIPGRGATDPQMRVWNGEVFMYATHDADPRATDFVMRDWWVWSSRDLVDWRLRSVIRPDQTYLGRPSIECWATDAAERNGRYYFYFSMGPENIGVLASDTPTGPWHDPLGRPLIAKGDVRTASRDPGILQEADGTSYIVFGTFDYYIARLNADMVSLAEKPRLIEIADKQGPGGKGKTDDKPFLHRRGDFYYLSWGSFYAMGRSPYGPFQCKGSLIDPAFVDPILDGSRTEANSLARKIPRHVWLNLDRHGSFFELHGQWYFACNDHSQPGTSAYYRDALLSHVHYRANGEIAPVRLSANGVGRHLASDLIRLADAFRIEGAEVREVGPDSFAVAALTVNAFVTLPKVRSLPQRATVTLTYDNAMTEAVVVEIRRGTPAGQKLAEMILAPGGGQATSPVASFRSQEDLCIVIRSHSAPRGGIALDVLRFESPG